MQLFIHNFIKSKIISQFHVVHCVHQLVLIILQPATAFVANRMWYGRWVTWAIWKLRIAVGITLDMTAILRERRLQSYGHEQNDKQTLHFKIRIGFHFKCFLSLNWSDWVSLVSCETKVYFLGDSNASMNSIITRTSSTHVSVFNEMLSKTIVRHNILSAVNW